MADRPQPTRTAGAGVPTRLPSPAAEQPEREERRAVPAARAEPAQEAGSAVRPVPAAFPPLPAAAVPARPAQARVAPEAEAEASALPQAAEPRTSASAPVRAAEVPPPEAVRAVPSPVAERRGQRREPGRTP